MIFLTDATRVLLSIGNTPEEYPIVFRQTLRIHYMYQTNNFYHHLHCDSSPRLGWPAQIALTENFLPLQLFRLSESIQFEIFGDIQFPLSLCFNMNVVADV